VYLLRMATAAAGGTAQVYLRHMATAAAGGTVHVCAGASAQHGSTHKFLSCTREFSATSWQLLTAVYNLQ
jgi:hypothetical protein